MSTKRETVGSLKWTALEQISVKAIFFVVQIILARLLLPEEFGIVAVVAIVLTLAGAFTDGGMGSALVQNKNIDRRDVSTVFVLNLILSLLLFGGIYLTSDWFARFYEEPMLSSILPFLAFGIVISACGQTQRQMLIKNLEFKRLFRISLPSVISGGIAGISMAIAGFGVWSLVAMRLVESFVQTVCVWCFCNPEWRPKLEFSPASIRKIAGYSLARLFTEILFKVSTNLHGLIIGKAYGMADLGFYNRARSFQSQPISALMTALNRVLFPVFAKNQDDDLKLKRSLQKGIPMLAFVVAPAMLLLMTIAKPLVLILLTEKWLPSVPLLRLIPLVGIATALSAPHVSILNGKGESKLIVGTATFKQALQIATVCLTWPFGLVTMVAGQVCCAIFNLMFNQLIVARCIDGDPFIKRTLAWFPYVAIGFMGCGLGWSVELLKLGNHYIELTIQATAFLGFYLAACHLTGLPGVRDLLALVQSKPNSGSTAVLPAREGDYQNG